MRDDPDDATASLVVELDDGAGPEPLRERVAAAGGDVVEALGFGCWLVRAPESAVADLCTLPGVTRIETDATLDRTVDETVDPGDDGEEPAPGTD